MGRTIAFTIYTMPLTLNQVMGKHWRARYHNFEKVKKEVADNVRGTYRGFRKARVTLIRYSSGTLDRDNLFFSFKSILDGLVLAKVMKDDGFDQVRELYAEQVKIKRGEPKRIEVLVEEVA